MTVPAPAGFRFFRESLAVPAAVFPDRVRRQLTITEAKGNGQLSIVLPATRLDWENLNRRIYPTKVMEKAINNKEFRAQMEGGFLICSGRDHPKTPYVPPTEGSHIVTDAFIEKFDGQNFLMNKWLTLPTSEGKNLRGLFEGGAAFGVSIRGFGRIEEGDSDQGILAEYQYIGTDGVGEPSAKLYAGMRVPNCRVVECVTPEIQVLEDRIVVAVNYPKAFMEGAGDHPAKVGDTVKLVGFGDSGKIISRGDDDYAVVQWEDGAQSNVMLIKNEADVRKAHVEKYRKNVGDFKECSCMEGDGEDDMCECPAHGESYKEKRTKEPHFAPVGLTAWKIEMKKLGAIKFTSDGNNLTLAWNAQGKEVGYWVDIFNVGYDFKGEQVLTELQNDYGKNKTALTGPSGMDGHIHSYDPYVSGGITGMGGVDLHTHVFSSSLPETAPGGTDGHTHWLTSVYATGATVMDSFSTDHYDPQSKTVANLMYAIDRLRSRAVDLEKVNGVVSKYMGKKTLEQMHWKTLDALLNELKSDEFKYIHRVEVSSSNEQVTDMAKAKREGLGRQEPSPHNKVANPPDSGATVPRANELGIGTDVKLGTKTLKVTANDGTTIKLSRDEKEDSSWPIDKLRKDATGYYFVQHEGVEEVEEGKEEVEEGNEEVPAAINEAYRVGGVKVSSIERPAGANYIIFTPEDPTQYLPLRNAITAQGALMYYPVPEGKVGMILAPEIEVSNLTWVIKDSVATDEQKAVQEHAEAPASALVPLPIDEASYEHLKTQATETLTRGGKVQAMRLFMNVESQLNKIESQELLTSSISMLDKLKNEMFGSSEGANALKKPHNEGKVVDQVNSLSRMIKEAHTLAEGIDRTQLSEKDKQTVRNLIEYVAAVEDLVANGAALVEASKKDVEGFIEAFRTNLVIEGDIADLKQALGIVEQSAQMIHNLKATLDESQDRASSAMHLLDHLRVFQRREYNTLKVRADASKKLVEHLRTRMKLMVANTQGKAVVPKDIAEAVTAIINARPELGNFREELMLCSKTPEQAIILAKKYLNVRSVETVQPLGESTVSPRRVGDGERFLRDGLR